MTSPNVSRRPDPAVIERLRARIRRIERSAPLVGHGDGAAAAATMPFGAPAIDRALPWGGLPRAALHEIAGGAIDGAAAGFCAALLARLAGPAGTVLWCGWRGGLYGPGLAGIGLDPGRLIVVRPRRAADLLWAMEEGLRSGGPMAVLGEVDDIAPTAARRLQLAAEEGGVTALLLRPAARAAAPLPATTRWRLSPAPPPTPMAAASAAAELWDAPRWRVELSRCRGGRPAAWVVEWHLTECEDGTAGGFVVAADLRDRPAEPALVAVGA